MTSETSATADTSKTIEDVALELFGRLGYHATTMRMIASNSNVRTSTLYYWYSSKEALLLSMIDGFLEGLSREVSAAVDAAEGPVDRLAAAIRTHVIFHGNNVAAALVTDNELRSLSDEHGPRVIATRDEYQERFFGLIEDGLDNGDFRATRPRIATYITLLAATSVDMWYRPDGPLELEEVAEAHVEFILGGLGRNPAG